MNTLILFLTLIAVVWYAWQTRRLAVISSDNFRISALPGLRCTVTAFDEHSGFGNIFLLNRSDKPCFFWLMVRAFRVNTPEDWTKSPAELTPLRRDSADPLGYYDGSQRRFMQPEETIIGVFPLDEIGSVLRGGQSVAIETLIWVTSDNRVTNKNDNKVIVYDPKRWILSPQGVQVQTRVLPIF